MEIRLKLMGTLKAKSPPGDRLDVDDRATIRHVLQTLEIPPDHVHLTMVNNSLERNFDRALAAGDELMVMAPVGGG